MDMPSLQTDTAYRVEISAHAWTQLGVVPRHDFLRLTRALEDVAARVARGERTALWMMAAADGLRVDGHELRFRVDDARRTVTLLEVVWDAPEPC